MSQVTPEMLCELALTPPLFLYIEEEMKQRASKNLMWFNIQMVEWADDPRRLVPWAPATISAALERWAAFRPEVSDGFLTLRWDLPAPG